MDLSKVSPHEGSTPDPAFNRETALPRAATDRPDLQVNEQIIRPDTSGAEQLQRLLGLAVDAAQKIAGQVQQRQDNEDSAAAMLDFAADAKNDPRFAKSRAYRDAWQLQGAKKLAVDIGDEATGAVNDRLNDEQNPATLQDIDGVIESTFQKHIIGPNGKPVNFGTPEAKMVLVHALNEVRSTLLPQAAAAIKHQTDAQFLTTWASNNVLEVRRGAPIGVDPLAPLPEDGAPSVPAAKTNATGAEPPTPARAPFNVAAALSQVPPSISKDTAKHFLLVSLFNEARSEGDASLLSGLEDSRRADGTPIFTPAEAYSILEMRQHVAEHAAKVATEARNELWQRNGGALLTAMISNRPPSDAFIASSAQKGLIDPSTAYTLIEHNRAAAREAASEARSEQRAADAEANADYDAFVAGEAARMIVGDFSGASADSLFQAGKLGPPGKKALARYNSLLAAERQGEERNRDNPLYGQYMGQLRLKYGGAASPYLAPQFGQGPVRATNFYGMMAFYKSKASKGMDPEEAYLATVERFGPPADAVAARRQLIAELRAKQAAPGR